MLGVAAAATTKMASASGKAPAVWALMGPYLAWVAYATALNGELLRTNSTVRACGSDGRGRGGGGRETSARCLSAGRADRGGAERRRRRCALQHAVTTLTLANHSNLNPITTTPQLPNNPQQQPHQQETLLDWQKVSKDVDEATAPARAAAKEKADAAAKAAKDAAAQATKAAKETADKAAAAAKETAEKAAAAASAVADEVKAKAAHDMAELKTALE